MRKSVQSIDSEQRFRSLFENNLDLLFYQNEEGVILDANTPFLALLHRPKDDVVGHHINDFLPEELIPLFRDKLREAFAGHAVTFEVAVQFKGAVAKVLSISKVPLRKQGVVTGVHVVGRDITALTASQQVIAEQATKLNTIFESITDALFVLDHDWHLTFLNHEVEQQLALDRQQVLGKTYAEVFPEEIGGVFERHYQQAFRTGQAVHFEAYFAQRQRWFEVKASPSEEGLSVYFSDITPRKEAEASQEKLAQDLYQHNLDLQEFSYLVSHKLRSPLANALGLASLLHPAEEGQAQVLAYLHQSLGQLDELLEELTTILDVRDRPSQAEPLVAVPLAEVLAQVLQRLQEPLQQAGGTVDVHFSPASLTVQGTSAYMFTICRNLLANAIAYRSAQRPLHITISGSQLPAGEVQVTMADNGSGFNRAKAGTDVFKLYKRFHAEPGGRGLGLYFVQAYVTAIGGRIAVQSQPDVGTEFLLSLRSVL